MSMHTSHAGNGTELETLLGRVADEFTDRLNQGQHPDIEDYVTRHPRLAVLLRQILPALQLIGASGTDLASRPAGEPWPQATGRLGDYQIVREIGRGGMGVVYEAMQVSLGRRVALKVLPFAAVIDQRQLARFKNEARAAAILTHQNIVPVYSIDSEHGVHYYAMQYVEGQSLAELIGQLRWRKGLESEKVHRSTDPPARLASQLLSGELAPANSAVGATEQNESTSTDTQHASVAPTPAGSKHIPSDKTTSGAARPTEAGFETVGFVRSVAQLGIQAAEGLEHAHQLGVVHRDIKPANLLVDVRGKLWITDFGLAQLQCDPRLTVTGDLLGTLRYMSPEQALANRATVDHRTDIYSLGVTLYELLTLEAAFPETDRQTLLHRIACEDPQLPRRLNRNIPVDVETILLKATAKNAAERYATAQDLADDLHRFLDNQPVRARRPTLRQRFTKWTVRHAALVWSAASVLLLTTLLLGVSGVWVYSAYLRESRARTDETDARQSADAARKAEVGQRERAEKSERIARERLYQAEMRLAMVDWNSGNVGRMADKLANHDAEGDQEDLRGWEWYYLLSLAHQDERTLFNYAPVSTVAWSANGRYLATASGRAVSIHDTTSWQIVQTWTAPSRVECLRWSPDSRQLACGAEVCVLRTDSGKVQRFADKHAMKVRTLAWSPDSKLLATAGFVDRSIRIWNVETGSCDRVLKRSRDGIGLGSLAWHPNGKWLALVCADGLLLLDSVSGEIVRSDRSANTLPTTSIAFHPNGDSLAVGTMEGQLNIYGVEGLSINKQWRCGNVVNCVAWNSDGSRLASVSYNQLVQVWEANSGNSVLQLRGHVSQAKSVTWEPGGHRLASGGLDGLVKVWDLSHRLQPLRLTPASVDLEAIAWCDDERNLMSFGGDTIAVWNVEDGECVRTVLAAPGDIARFSADGKVVAVASSSAAGRPALAVYDASSGAQMQAVNTTIRSPRGFRFSPDPSMLAISGGAGPSGVEVVEVVDLHKNKVVFHADTILCVKDAIDSLSWSWGGCLLAAAGCGEDSDADQSRAAWVHVWDVTTGDRVLKARHGNSMVYAETVAWDSSGRLLASGDHTGLVEVREVPSGHKLVSTMLHAGLVTAMAWSPDNRRIASGSDESTVRIWDPATGEELLKLELPGGHAKQLVWSRSGQRLAAVGDDGSIYIWDASKGYAYVDSNAWYLERVLHRLDRAKQLEEAGRIDDAVAKYQQTLEYAEAKLGLGHAARLRALHRLAVARAEAGQWREAIALFEQLFDYEYSVASRGSLVDEMARDLRRLMTTAATTGRYEHAVTLATIANPVIADSRMQLNSIAWSLATSPDLQSRSPSVAVELAAKALDLMPTNRAVCNTLGVAQYRAGNWAEAISTLHKSAQLDAHGGDSFDWFFLAMAHAQLGQTEEANAWYVRGVEWMKKNKPGSEELRRFRKEAALLLGRQGAQRN